MVTYAVLKVLAVFVLVALNAFFVAAEFALVSVRDTRIEHLISARRIGARTVQKLHKNLDEVLNAVQFGITLASLALGWLGEPTLAHLIEPTLGGIPYANVYAHGIAITLAFMVITYLHVILGEVVPKSLALLRAERVALAVAAPMDVFMTIARPFLYVMTRSSLLILRAMGARQVREAGVHSPEELKLIVTSSRRFGLLPPLQEEVIHRALEIGNVTVREIMMPRPDIFSLPSDMSLDDALTRVVQEQHSRVPIYDVTRGPEHIIGILYAKDLMRWLRAKMQRSAEGDQVASLPRAVRQIMRDVLFVPETKPLPDLLADFKARKRHLAVVVDEFGSTVGVVTVEDALEQLVGELEDEYDIAEQHAAAIAGTVIVDGSISIRDLETYYLLSLPRDEGFETLAGFMLAQLQRIPRIGDTVEYRGRRFSVLSMDGHRIARVKIEALTTEAVAAREAGRS
jgi:putative hemolysin